MLCVKLSVFKEQKLPPVMEQCLLWVWQDPVPTEAQGVNPKQNTLTPPNEGQMVIMPLSFILPHMNYLGSSPAHTDHHSRHWWLLLNKQQEQLLNSGLTILLPGVSIVMLSIIVSLYICESSYWYWTMNQLRVSHSDKRQTPKIINHPVNNYSPFSVEKNTYLPSTNQTYQQPNITSKPARSLSNMKTKLTTKQIL